MVLQEVKSNYFTYLLFKIFSQSVNSYLKVDLDIISDQRCLDTPNAGTFVPGQMFCAGHLTGGKETSSNNHHF